MLGGDEGSAEGALLENAAGMSDGNVVGIDVGSFDTTRDGTGDGAVLDADGVVVDLL